MAVIDTAGIYNNGQKDFIYNEGTDDLYGFLFPMISENCIEIIDFLYLNNADGNFFLCRKNHLIGIFKLRTDKVFNKVLLEHKSSILLEGISDQLTEL